MNDMELLIAGRTNGDKLHRAALGAIDCQVDKECRRRLSFSTGEIPIESLEMAAQSLKAWTQ